MMCLNKKVIAGLAVVALGVYLFAPNLFGAALPLLILAVCPLSMLVMMRMMSGSSEGASCSSGLSSGDTDAEVAQLRAEVEGLRAEQRARRNADSPIHEHN
jgi:hypothetical protein